MLKVRTRKIVNVAAGTLLGLSDDQARRRAHNLTKEGGRYRANVAVQFKAGEEFEIDGMSKQHAPAFEVIDPEKPRRGRPPKAS